MANGTEKRDLKKVFFGGLKGEVTEDLLRLVMEPAAKAEAIVSVTIVADQKHAGKKLGFVECKDEATAAGIIDFLNGASIPEIAEGEVQAALAFDRNKPERTPRPRLTGVEVDDIAATLFANPRFAEKCKGKPGDPGEKGEIGPAGPQGPKGDPGEKGDIGPAGPQGSAGPQGPKGPEGPQGSAGADGTVGPPTGPQGLRGQDAPKAAWILCLLVASAALLVVLGHAFCGSAQDGERGPQGIHGQDGERGPQGPEGLAGPQGPKGDPAPVTAVEEAVSAEPEADPAPETAPAVTPAPEPAAPRAVGAIVVRDRFDRVEVRLDDVERDLHDHFCSGSGPHDPERCAATH